ncbi:MAG: hypothetical protein ACK44A_03585 [Roseateles sp.]
MAVLAGLLGVLVAQRRIAGLAVGQLGVAQVLADRHATGVDAS